MAKLLYTALLVLFYHVAFSQEDNSEFFNDGINPNKIDHALKLSITDIAFGKLGLLYEADFGTRVNLEVGAGMLGMWFSNPSSIRFSFDNYNQINVDGGYYISIAPFYDVCDCDLGEYWGIGPKYTYYGLNQTPESAYDGLSTISALLKYQQIWNDGSLFWEVELGLGLAFYSPANSQIQAKTNFMLPFSGGFGFLF